MPILTIVKINEIGKAVIITTIVSNHQDYDDYEPTSEL